MSKHSAGRTPSVEMGSLIGAILTYLYFSLIAVKYFVHFENGWIDIVILSVAFSLVLMNGKLLITSATRLPSKKIIALFILLLAYYLFLVGRYQAELLQSILEYISIYKWIFYYIAGLLLGLCFRRSDEVLIGRWHILMVSTVVLIFSVATYNWSRLVSFGLFSYSGYYLNSYGSIFEIRSVFALFALVILIYAINGRKHWTSIVLLLYSLIFLYMAGNRKTIAALTFLYLAMSTIRKYQNAVRLIKIVSLAILVVILPYTDIFRHTVSEYSKGSQPRIFTYRSAYNIARDFFPIGSGPATFASTGSIRNYSIIYVKYGFSQKWGFRPYDREQFHNDTYWAQIVGQYGFIGVLLTVALLILVGRDSRKLNYQENIRIGHQYIVAMLFILSISTPVFQRTEVALFLFMQIGFGLTRAATKSIR